MYAQVDKQKDNKSRGVANSVTQKKSNVKQGFGFVDNRTQPLSTTILKKYNVVQSKGTLPIQLYATFDDVKKEGEKILKSNPELIDEETAQQKAPIQNKVVQRLINAPISLGNPYTFQVVPADIGTGTATTPGTRAFVNGGGAPLAPTATFAYGFFPPGAAFVPGAAPGPLNVAPNPPPIAGNYDAGHALGRQSGGLGHVNNWVFPQDRNVNRGWAGNFPLWRAHENNFRNGVAVLAPGGFGIWHVTLP